MFHRVKPKQESDRESGGGGASQTADPSRGTPAGQGGGEAGAVLRFEPASLVRGIVFHVLDEGIAGDVSRDSVKSTVERLQARQVRPSIDRARWAAMTNPERLEWLLSESRTVTPVLFGRMAVLTPAKS